MKEVDEHICDVKLALDAGGITEYSLSDNEDQYPIPPSSDNMQHYGASSSTSASTSAASDSEDGGSQQDYQTETSCIEEVEEGGHLKT